MTPDDVVDGDDWAWEVALGGLRVMVTLLPGHVDVHDGEGNLVNAAFPDVRRIGRSTGSVEAVLDGVIVGDPEHLARRLAKAPASARRAAEATPVKLVAFDLVWLDGHPRWDDPWDDRRAALDELELDGPAWTASTAHVGDGPVLLQAAGQHDAPGLIGKHRSSPYRPGKRSADWRVVSTS